MNQIGESVAAVGEVGELGKITWRIFGVQGMVGAVKGSLDVAKHPVDPSRVRRLAAVRSPSGHSLAVLATGCGHPYAAATRHQQF